MTVANSCFLRPKLNSSGIIGADLNSLCQEFEPETIKKENRKITLISGELKKKTNVSYSPPCGKVRYDGKFLYNSDDECKESSLATQLKNLTSNEHASHGMPS